MIVLLLILLCSCPALACVPQPFLFYPMNIMALLMFAGILYFKKYQSKYLVYYLLMLFLGGFIAPVIPVYLFMTLPAIIILFVSSVADESTKRKIICVCGYVLVIMAVFVVPVVTIPLIILYFIQKRKNKPVEGEINKSCEDKRKIELSERAPEKQQIIAAIVFITILLTIPLYALYIGTDVKGIIMFFSLFMLVLAMIFIRTIIRRSGIPADEWKKRLIISGSLFFIAAFMTWSIKVNTFFGSSMDNFLAVLIVKKEQFLIVFLLLLIAPIMFIGEEYIVKKRLKQSV